MIFNSHGILFPFQTKMDEERALYDQERDSTDERFRAFEDKIKGTIPVFLVFKYKNEK